jgi:enoyl-[acyl-carrier protein] reductase I
MTAPARLRALIVGVANDRSIAWAIARALHARGAEIAMTYVNDKARRFVEPLAATIGASILMPLDVRNPDEQAALYAAIAGRWGGLDALLHSIAFARREDLHGRVIDSSAEGFAEAMDISCHSLMRLSRAAAPLMGAGGSILTLSYYGAEKAVPGYGIMGPVKAALESSVRALAAELGSVGIRVNALSPGPLATRAASGIAGFDDLLAQASARAPLPGGLDIEHVGAAGAFLLSPEASAITGQTLRVDCGLSAIA